MQTRRKTKFGDSDAHLSDIRITKSNSVSTNLQDKNGVKLQYVELENDDNFVVVGFNLLQPDAVFPIAGNAVFDPDDTPSIKLTDNTEIMMSTINKFIIEARRKLRDGE